MLAIYNRWGFLVPPSEMHKVLVSAKWANVSIIGKHMCDWMDIHSLIYLLVNESGPPSTLNITVKCKSGPIYHLLIGLSANGYPFSHTSTV